MKKCDDKKVLDKAVETKDEQIKTSRGFSFFRKQFEEYQQAKGTAAREQQAVSKPYLEAFVQRRDNEGN